MKKNCATNFSQYCWPKIGGKWSDIRDLFRFKTKNFPRMPSEIVLPGGQMKDQHKQCKLAAIFMFSSSTCITQAKKPTGKYVKGGPFTLKNTLFYSKIM